MCFLDKSLELFYVFIEVGSGCSVLLILTAYLFKVKERSPLITAFTHSFCKRNKCHNISYCLNAMAGESQIQCLYCMSAASGLVYCEGFTVKYLLCNCGQIVDKQTEKLSGHFLITIMPLNWS